MADNVEVDDDRKANATRRQRFWTEALPTKPSRLTKLDSFRREAWDEEMFDNDHDPSRHSTRKQLKHANLIYQQKMRAVISRMNKKLKFIPEGAFRFLDIGCAPGGFKSGILNRNKDPATRGIGLTLPQEHGGFALIYDDVVEHARFEAYMGDITSYQLCSSTGNTQLKPLPRIVSEGAFDLVILDAHPIRAHPQKHAGHNMICQLVIGLQAVQKGGTIIMNLTKPELVTTAQVLFMLHGISQKLSVHKPLNIHGNRSSFYAVAQGIGEAESVEQTGVYLSHLQALWMEMIRGNDGHGRPLQFEDLNFIATVEQLVENRTWLISLAREVWQGQTKGLLDSFQKLELRG